MDSAGNNGFNPLGLGDQESGIDLGFDVTEFLRGSFDMDDFFVTTPIITDSLGPIPVTQDVPQDTLLQQSQPHINQIATSVAVPPSSLSLASLTSSLAAMNVPHPVVPTVSSAPVQVSNNNENPQNSDSFYQLKSTPVVGGAPNFKSSSVRSRTQLKQELMRDKLAQEERKEQEALIKRRKEQQQSSAVSFQPPVPNVEVPAQVFQVKTRLENPTRYYVKQSQERQVRQFLSQSIGGSVPQSPTAGMSPASGGIGAHIAKLPVNARLQQVITSGTHALSAPPTLLATTPLSPAEFGGTSSPAPQSSLATSLNSVGSDVEADLVEDILSLEAGEPSRDLSDILSDLKCGTNDAPLPGINYPTSADMPEKSSSFPGEPYSPDDQIRQAKDRQKKDNHNMIERRRRFNINDRIKELATLLPRNQTDPYFDKVGEFRPNKGTILKASVEFIKLLKSESEKLRMIESKQVELEEHNRKLMLRIQELERQTKQGGGVSLPPDDLTWKSSSPTMMDNLLKAKTDIKIKQEPGLTPLCVLDDHHSIDDLMDEDGHLVTGSVDPMLTQTIENLDEMNPTLQDRMDY